MKIKQFSFNHTTYGNMFAYLLCTRNKCIAIDPNPCNEIDKWCKDNKLRIALVTNTHLHSDHTEGNRYLSIKKIFPFLNLTMQQNRNRSLLKVNI